MRSPAPQPSGHSLTGRDHPKVLQSRPERQHHGLLALHPSSHQPSPPLNVERYTINPFMGAYQRNRVMHVY